MGIVGFKIDSVINEFKKLFIALFFNQFKNMYPKIAKARKTIQMPYLFLLFENQTFVRDSIE